MSYALLLYGMKPDDIIEELVNLLNLDNTTTEDVFYNAGVIDSIKAIEKLGLKEH